MIHIEVTWTITVTFFLEQLSVFLRVANYLYLLNFLWINPPFYVLTINPSLPLEVRYFSTYIQIHQMSYKSHLFGNVTPSDF